MALELSMAAPTITPTATTSTSTLPATLSSTTGVGANLLGDLGSTSGFMDPAFVSQLLGSVDVDQNDPLFQAALAQLNSAGSAAGSSAGLGSSADGNGEGEGGKESKNNKRKGNDGA